jgi:hypothetical protein
MPTSTRDRWKRLTALFAAAKSLPADRRRPFLEAETRGDADLLREALELLEESEDPAFLESGPPDANLGRRVGDYVIEALVGERHGARLPRAT